MTCRSEQGTRNQWLRVHHYSFVTIVLRFAAGLAALRWAARSCEGPVDVLLIVMCGSRAVPIALSEHAGRSIGLADRGHLRWLSFLVEQVTVIGHFGPKQLQGLLTFSKAERHVYVIEATVVGDGFFSSRQRPRPHLSDAPRRRRVLVRVCTTLPWRCAVVLGGASRRGTLCFRRRSELLLRCTGSANHEVFILPEFARYGALCV
jgi:hypothetical protein